ncbi:MAG: phospholipid-binding protein MlaC [Pseudohongiellaceae bacterium]
MNSIPQCLLLIVSLALTSLAQGQPASPREYIDEASSALAATSTIENEDARLSALDEVVGEYFDLAVVARGVLGGHRDTLNAEQTQRFTGEFQKALVGLMFAALSEIGSYELSVQEARMRGEDRAQVPALIKTASEGDFEFLFSLARNEGRWNVLNLIVNGVNLGLTYRNQFNELMLSNDGDVDAVIVAWTATVAESAPDL